MRLSWVGATVAGLRWRGSWRRFDTPLSLLKEELDLDALP